MSLINKRNDRGAELVPGGTPWVIELLSVFTSSSDTYCCMFVKSNLSHCMATPRISNESWSPIRKEWSRQSNISFSIKKEWSYRTTIVEAVEVHLLAGDQYWSSLNQLLFMDSEVNDQILLLQILYLLQDSKRSDSSCSSRSNFYSYKWERWQLSLINFENDSILKIY